MKNNIPLLLISLIVGMIVLTRNVFSQNYNMSNGTTNTCTGNFYDSGGPSGNYSNDENVTKTFCSCNGGTITVSFSYFDIEDPIVPYDLLNIYDGPNTTSPPVGIFSGTNSPGTVTSSGTCLTFNFISDGATTYPGWVAAINCTPGVTVPTISSSGSTTFCPGGNVTLTASSGTSYSWNTGSTTQSIVASTSGSYYVAVGTGSCAAGSAPVNVTVKPTPTVTATGAATICPGSSTSLMASGATSYSWAPAASLTNPNISNPYASPSITTTYSVTGTGSNGCTKTSTVTVTTKTVPAAMISGNTAICEGNTSTLTASGGVSYVWNTGATTSTILVNPSTTTNYSVLVTGSNGCTASASSVVTVNSVSAAVAALPETICNGASSTLSASGGNSYLWSTGETTSSIVVTPTNTSGYSVQVTDANCSDTAMETITVNPLPATPSITPNGNVLTSSIGASYQWYFNSAIISGATNQTYTVTQTGAYSVCISDANGCSSCSAGYNATVTAITDLSASEAVTIFPNPNNGEFKIDFEAPRQEDYSIELINAFGQLLFSKTYASKDMGSKEFDLSSYGPGMYVLLLKSSNFISIHKITVY